METALRTWVNLGHTTVLVNEGTGAEMGGAWFGFELLETEPPRGVIDPLPEAWGHLASMLEALEVLARPIDPGVAKELAAAAASTRKYASLAAQQRDGQPLGKEGYEAINNYGRAIEHPFLKLQAALHPTEGIAGPDPMIKIVDVQSWKVPGETQIWHVAVGRPQAVTVLLGDRGVVVPGHGAVYSYEEVMAGRRLDDQAVRAVVDQTPRPAGLAAIRTATTPGSARGGGCWRGAVEGEVAQPYGEEELEVFEALRVGLCQKLFFFQRDLLDEFVSLFDAEAAQIGERPFSDPDIPGKRVETASFAGGAGAGAHHR